MALLGAAKAPIPAAFAPNPASIRSRPGTTISFKFEPSGFNLPDTAIGVGVAVWDKYMTSSGVVPYLKAAGVKVLRYPGGSYADVYHWRTGKGTKGTTLTIAPNTDTESFNGLRRKLGAQALITVNYGSNPEGTGGATPSEAASWVRYTNKSHHWNFKYWEIGNEIYGNGFYNGLGWEEDLHSAAKLRHRQNDPLLSPTTYGKNVAKFAVAMKKVDPTIKIGAVLTTPDNWPDQVQPLWNPNVLAHCGKSIDFVVIHFYPSANTESALYQSIQAIPGCMKKLRSLLTSQLGKRGETMPIWVSEGDSNLFNTHLPGALFAADSLATWFENGLANFDWWNLHNGLNQVRTGMYDDQGLFSNGSSVDGHQEPPVNAPFPAYWGIRLYSEFARPGDRLIRASCDNPALAVHGAIAPDGARRSVLVTNTGDTDIQVPVSTLFPGFQIAHLKTLTLGEQALHLIETETASPAADYSILIPAKRVVVLVATKGNS